MSTVIIIQIMFITIGMVALGLFLNKIFGLNLETARELKDKALNIQERMRTAQVTGDPQEMIKLQQESTALMKQMMKKQLIPLGVRCLVFIGIFALIGILYADYAAGLLPFEIPLFGSGWFAIYFLFSIGFSLLVFIIKKIYRKLTGKVDTRTKISREITEALSPTTQGSGFQLTRPLPSRTKAEISSTDDKTEKLDSWKDRIKNKS